MSAPTTEQVAVDGAGAIMRIDDELHYRVNAADPCRMVRITAFDRQADGSPVVVEFEGVDVALEVWADEAHRFHRPGEQLILKRCEL